jgi:hypothetical protein
MSHPLRHYPTNKIAPTAYELATSQQLATHNVQRNQSNNVASKKRKNIPPGQKPEIRRAVNKDNGANPPKQNLYFLRSLRYLLFTALLLADT